MERNDKFSSFFWLCLGLIIIYSAYKLRLGNLRQPGPGLFIFIMGICLSLLALGVFISSCRREIKGTQSVLSLWAGLEWKLPIYIFIILLIYSIILKLGYLLSTTFLMVFLFGLFERKKWKFVIVGAVLSVLISYLVFGVWLQIRFPRGVFEDLIRRG